MKFYAFFKDGVAVQQTQLDESIDAPEGMTEISEENFGKQLKLVGGEVRQQTPEELEAKAQAEQLLMLKMVLDGAVQAHMDTVVQGRGYTSMIYAVSYYNSTKPRFKAEAEAAVKFRDDVWEKCIEVLSAVEAGEREIPSVEELIAELPLIEWPVV